MEERPETIQVKGRETRMERGKLYGHQVYQEKGAKRIVHMDFYKAVESSRTH